MGWLVDHFDISLKRSRVGGGGTVRWGAGVGGEGGGVSGRCGGRGSEVRSVGYLVSVSSGN